MSAFKSWITSFKMPMEQYMCFWVNKIVHLCLTLLLTWLIILFFFNLFSFGPLCFFWILKFEIWKYVSPICVIFGSSCCFSWVNFGVYSFDDYLLVVLIWVFLLLVVLCIWSCFFMFYMKSFLGYYINVALIFRCLFPFTKLSLCMKMWHYVWNHPHVALYITTEFFEIFFWKFWSNVRPEKHFEH